MMLQLPADTIRGRMDRINKLSITLWLVRAFINAPKVVEGPRVCARRGSRKCGAIVAVSTREVLRQSQ